MSSSEKCCSQEDIEQVEPKLLWDEFQIKIYTCEKIWTKPQPNMQFWILTLKTPRRIKLSLIT